MSFRTARTTGNRLFYGFHREDDKAKAFRLDKIQSVEVTNVPYAEKRHPVEIIASDKIPMPLVKSSIRKNQFSYSDPKHVYECSYCGRKFRRKHRNTVLNAHKDKDGNPCLGRTGYYLGYE